MLRVRFNHETITLKGLTQGVTLDGDPERAAELRAAYAASDWRVVHVADATPGNDEAWVGVGRALCSPSLRTGQADLPHPALQLVVHLGED
jgi:hypothetical protein